jgi:hypothetical protein
LKRNSADAASTPGTLTLQPAGKFGDFLTGRRPAQDGPKGGLHQFAIIANCRQPASQAPLAGHKPLADRLGVRDEQRLASAALKVTGSRVEGGCQFGRLFIQRGKPLR